MLINFAFCLNKMYMIKLNLWLGNISIIIIMVHIIIKREIYLFMFIRKQRVFIGAINSNNEH